MATRKYEYLRMTPVELQDELEALELSIGQFARLYGVRRDLVIRWLDPTDTRVTPHAVSIMCSLLHLPGAMDIALEITNEAIEDAP